MLKKIAPFFLLAALVLTLPLAAQNPKVKLETTKGDIVIELDAEKAPITTENFLRYVADGFYDGTIFHRVIPDFMVQGGGFDESMNRRDTRDPIQNEADNGLENGRGTVAMARTSDPHSATAQFFINSTDNVFLNHSDKTPDGWGYAVFGKVVEGLDFVDTISMVETTMAAGGGENVPVEPIIINKATKVVE